MPPSAAFGQIGEAYVKAIHRFAESQNRVVLIGIAQEKASVWRSWTSPGQQKARHPHMEWQRQMAFVNHFYFYLWDSEWGGAFWKVNAYARFPIWLWLNGHEWAKRQLAKAGISYQALDNGFGSCNDPDRLQKICDRLGPGAVTSFFGAGCAVCPRRSPRLICEPVTFTNWLSGNSRSRRPVCLTARKRAGCGLRP